MKRRRIRVAGLLAAAVMCGVATQARAQHVVTEAEAAKLTLQALTAPPPRPIYRSYVRRAMATRFLWRDHGASSAGRFESRHGHHALVHASDRRPVVLRHQAASPALHHHASHGRLPRR